MKLKIGVTFKEMERLLAARLYLLQAQDRLWRTRRMGASNRCLREEELRVTIFIDHVWEMQQLCQET